MPEYLAPGVYVEDTSFRSKAIEGVSTSTTGLVGSCRYGPLSGSTGDLTSLIEFERIYGDSGQLAFAESTTAPAILAEKENYLWHAVRAFFAEGGRRLQVARVFNPLRQSADESDEFANVGSVDDARNAGGRARCLLKTIDLQARFPGAMGNFLVELTVTAGENVVLGPAVAGPAGTSSWSSALRDRDVVLLRHRRTKSAAAEKLYLAELDAEHQAWSFRDQSGKRHTLDALNSHGSMTGTIEAVHVVTVTVRVRLNASGRELGAWSGLAFDPHHTREGKPDSLFARFAADAAAPTDTTFPPLTILQRRKSSGLKALLAFAPALAKPTADGVSAARRIHESMTVTFALTGGNDGVRPQAADYEGNVGDASAPKTGLAQFEDADEIAIVAAPGSTADFADSVARDTAHGVYDALIRHAEKMKYRIAVLDCGNSQSVAEVRVTKARLNSAYAAFYYPWVTITAPTTNRPLNVPPSGFVAGIYARNDVERGVWKAPANEVVTLAIGFEQSLMTSQQDILNPEGINCFRFFEGRGYRLWGARTTSSDPEWKYVNLRRYFAFIEHSIDHGTQWTVFEPNNEMLWANVRRTTEDFLLNQWQSGALLGDKPEKAYFVKCDRTTMTQNDLDNGRLVCLVGVAPLRPAEFVIFRIGQWTADRK